MEAKETDLICLHCGQQIEDIGSKYEALRYRHKNGYYGCNRAVPSHSTTYAEPKLENPQQ